MRAQGGDVRELGGLEIGAEPCCEFGLAAALVRERQQIDHQTAGRRVWKLFEQPVEGPPVGVAGEQLVAVDEVEQRHRFAPQGVDDVAVIDDMGKLAGRHRAGPAGDGRSAGRHRVEDLLERKAARRGHGDERLLMVAGPLSGQTLQCGRCNAGRSASMRLA